jgi:hypothetical protein
MPKTSLADFLTDWEKLLKNVTDTSAELPNMDVYKNALDQLLGGAKDSLALAAARIGVKQQETKERQELLKQGKEAASKLRSAIKAHFGPKSERLLQYGIKPIRNRPKKVTQPVTEKPKLEAPAPVPAHAPHAGAAPQAS